MVEVDVSILFHQGLEAIQADLLQFFQNLGEVSIQGHNFFHLFNLEAAALQKDLMLESPLTLAFSLYPQASGKSEEDLQHFETHVGFLPGSCVTLGTVTRHPQAIPVVYGIALALARTFSGVVEIDDPLMDRGLDEPDWQAGFAKLQQQFEPHLGQIWAAPYLTGNNEIWFSTVVDADFLAWLLSQDNLWPLLGR